MMCNRIPQVTACGQLEYALPERQVLNVLSATAMNERQEEAKVSEKWWQTKILKDFVKDIN